MYFPATRPGFHSRRERGRRTAGSPPAFISLFILREWEHEFLFLFYYLVPLPSFSDASGRRENQKASVLRSRIYDSPGVLCGRQSSIPGRDSGRGGVPFAAGLEAAGNGRRAGRGAGGPAPLSSIRGAGLSPSPPSPSPFHSRRDSGPPASIRGGTQLLPTTLPFAAGLGSPPSPSPFHSRRDS